MRFVGKAYLHKKHLTEQYSEVHHGSFLRTVLKCNASHSLMALLVTCTAELQLHYLVSIITIANKGSNYLFTTPMQET